MTIDDPFLVTSTAIENSWHSEDGESWRTSSRTVGISRSFSALALQRGARTNVSTCAFAKQGFVPSAPVPTRTIARTAPCPTPLRRPSVSRRSSRSCGYGPHPHADTVVAVRCGGRGWEAAHRVMFVSLFTCTRSHVTCRRCHVSTRQVQAGVPGRPERGQDQHHHAVHVRQVRQHLPGACACDVRTWATTRTESTCVRVEIEGRRGPRTVARNRPSSYVHGTIPWTSCRGKERIKPVQEKRR